MESLGRMVAIILAVILLLLFPLRYDSLMKKETVESFLNQEMEHFFHQMTVKHSVDIMMYDNFMQQISATGDLYTVEIERYVPIAYQEESGTYLEYENVTEQLKLGFKVDFEEEDYLVVNLYKNSESFYDKLSNLFLPIFPESVQLTIGGGMQ